MPNPAPNQPVSQAPVSRTGDTLTVGCRLPNGLVMQTFELREKVIQRPDGTDKTVMAAVATSDRIKLNGAAKYRGGGKEMEHEIHHGAGLTFGVPADVFAAFIRQNEDQDWVKKGLVFAHKRDTYGQANEHKGQITGLEPLDPKNLPGEFRGKIERAQAA